jgi:capsular exopolysaccharide synthesis family protein
MTNPLELPAEDDPQAKNLTLQKREFEPVGYPYHAGDGFGEPQDTEAGVDLRNILRILNKRKWFIGGSLATCLVGGLLWTLLKTPLYTATLRLEIARSAPKILKGEDMGESDAAELETEIELLKSRNLAERVASLTNSARDLGPTKSLNPGTATSSEFGHRTRADLEREAANEILVGLAVKLVPGTRLVDVSYNDPQPARAQRIANAYGDAYVAANLDKRFQSNAHAKTFLEDRLKQIKLRLEDSQRTLLAFAEKEQIIATTDKASIAETDLAAANAALGGLIAERIKNEQLWRQAQSASGIDLPQILTNKVIEELRGRRGQLVTDYQEKSETFRADYPAMIQLNNKIKEIDRQVGVEVKAIKSSLKAAFEASLSQENEMKQRIEKLRAEALDLQKRSIQYNTLKHEVETTRSLYESLLQRFKEVDVASGVGTNNIFVVDRAQLPRAPSSPDKLKSLLIALAIGLAIGAGGTFALEQFDDVIYSPLEAELASGLTLLGVVPKAKNGQTVGAACEDGRSAISEAIRSLCTSLHYSTENGVPKTLVITSSMLGEGKSSIALGTARTFAGTGLKVLIVDADLRNPSLHKKAGLANSIGLTSYLTHNCEVRDAIQQSDITNLYIMTSGPLPPNPVELLHGPRFASFLSVEGEIFDLIIIDAPPVMGMADTLVLANMASTTLLVIAAGDSRIHQVRGTLKRLKLARSRPLGIVLNKFAAPVGYGYGYGYGYDYGYGYGAEREVDHNDELENKPDGPRKLSSGAGAA